MTHHRFFDLTSRAAEEVWATGPLIRSGLLRPVGPRGVLASATAFRSYGALGATVRIAAIRQPHRTAIIDELGVITFGELDASSNAIARQWRRRGLRAGDGVAILARNHRGFLQAVFAAAKCGARIILLNTDFGAAQVQGVVQREGAVLVVYDEEYAAAVSGLDLRHGSWMAWTDTAESAAAANSLATLTGGDPTPPPPSGGEPRIVILTSGTTGTPKGANRSEPRSLVPVGGLLDKVPLRAGEVTECCVPMFHALGFAHAVLAVALGSTLILRRRFDPQATLDGVRKHGTSAWIVVPVMLRRLIELPPADGTSNRSTSLRVVFVAGSQLGASLCQRATAALGPVLYNLYGSTEVAYATIATPDDLANEPGCVGRVVHGAIVKIFDDAGTEAPAGVTGRIFVANAVQFEGYTGGGGKDTIAGLMASGDVGHFDAAGRLFIDGRDDDMIVSGGENVFPAEIEETLAAHPDILEAAAIGVDDEDYGQRLRCFVVTRDGAQLNEHQVKDYVKAELARFKVPRDVHFVPALPRNPTGKVLKARLDEGARHDTR
jgi:fatty-acyl-CoA synthase